MRVGKNTMLGLLDALYHLEPPQVRFLCDQLAPRKDGRPGMV